MPRLGRPVAPGNSPRAYYLAVVGAWLLGAELVVIATARGGLPAPLGTLGGGTFVVASGGLLLAVGRRDLANRQALALLLHQHEEALASLSALTDASMAILPLDRLLDDLLVRLQEVLGVDTAAILLTQEGSSDLVVESWRGPAAEAPTGTTVSIDEGIVGGIAASSEPVVVEDTGGLEPQPPLLAGLTSLAGCRIMVRGRLIGICLVGSAVRMRFVDRDLQLLQLVADRAGVGIERKLMESGMREAQRMEAIGQVAGGVAHDFNNLLTVITGYTDLLYQRLAPDDANREMLAGISDSAARASLLTGQLLTIGRRQEPKPVVIEPGAALSALSEVLGRVLGIDVKLRWSLDKEAGNVSIDPARFEQLILNLAINARDAMPDGGQLEIACAPAVLNAQQAEALPLPPGRYVRVSVADTGSGMDEETRRRCFEAFFTTKERSRGTGLGLAAVQGVVAEGGGAITVSSRLGEGTRFDIYLPRSEEEVAAKVAEPPPAVIQGAETVLVVEDQADVRGLICRVLEKGGYLVLSAEDGPTALDLSEHWPHQIDLVVTDVVMPRMRGPEVVDKLKQARPCIAVLYVSGDTDGTSVADRVAADAAGFLAKPFKPSELSTRVRRVLDESRL